MTRRPLSIALLVGFCAASGCSDPDPVHQSTTADAGVDDVAMDAMGEGGEDTEAPRDVEAETTADVAPDVPDPTPTVERVGAFVSGVHGMAIAANGDLYYTDSFDASGQGSALYRLEPPWTGASIATGVTGALLAGVLIEGEAMFVCDTSANVVIELDADLNEVRRWQARSPWNVARSSGALHTVSFDNVFERLNEGAAPETIRDDLDAPFDLQPMEDGTIWISEQGEAGPGMVRRFSAQGEVLETLEWPFDIPEGLAVDASGDLWIAETGAGNVLRLHDGELEVVTSEAGIPIVVAPHIDGGIVFNDNQPPSLWRVTLTSR